MLSFIREDVSVSSEASSEARRESWVVLNVVGLMGDDEEDGEGGLGLSVSGFDDIWVNWKVGKLKMNL